MGLSVTYTTPDGHTIVVGQHILDVARRISEGDGTNGWSGDERMWVEWNPVDNEYEVWRLGEDNKPRFIRGWPPNEFDARVLKWLGEHDLRRRGQTILEDIEKAEERREKSVQENLDYIEKHLKKDLEWINKKLYNPGFDAPTPRR